jgi:hypothetical protein
MLSPVPPAAAGSDPAFAPLAVSFSIRALAEPGVMPRVMQLFAKRGLVPRRWNSIASASGLSIDVEMTGLDHDAADYIARCMRLIHGVETVLTVESLHPA